MFDKIKDALKSDKKGVLHPAIFTKVGRSLPQPVRNAIGAVGLNGKALGTTDPAKKAEYKKRAGELIMQKRNLREGAIKDFVRGVARTLGPTPQSDRAGNDPNEYVKPSAKKKPMKKLDEGKPGAYDSWGPDKRQSIKSAGKKLEEAVSRKLIAKKNATKQRVKYVQRKGELPPIMKGKGRYKITNKETSKLKDILNKQKSFRRDAKNASLEKKKGYTLPEPKAAEVPAPTSSRATSMTTFAKTPLPGEHMHNAQPFNNARQDPVRATQSQPAPKKASSTADDLLRGYNFWSGQYGQSGEQKHMDLAKKAALGHYAAMIAKISHHPGHPDFEIAKSDAKTMLDSHLDALRSIETNVPKRLEAPKRKGFLSRLLRK